MIKTIAIVVLSMIACAELAGADTFYVATVERVWGYNTVLRGEQKRLLTSNMQLLPSDKIKTGKSSGVHIVFNDGTVVRLDASMLIEVRQYMPANSKLAYAVAVAEQLIKQAKLARADLCAPKILAKAELSLAKAKQADQVQATPLIEQAVAYAKRAERLSQQTCHEITTVILLPDEHGNVGQISLSANGVSQLIDQPFSASSVQGSTSIPSAVSYLGKDAVMEQFSEILKSQPAKRVSFTVYFATGKSDLTAVSSRMLAQVVQASREHAPTEIHIIAHTDRVGSNATNMRISRKRAEAVQARLLNMDSTLAPTYIRYHGENDPLITTPDGVAEPQNRRVEIVVL